MARPEYWRKTVECDTEGCDATFERNSPRHKYCKPCAKARKEGYYVIWYNELGGKLTKKTYYQTVLKSKKDFRGEFDEHNEKGQIDE